MILHKILESSEAEIFSTLFEAGSLINLQLLLDKLLHCLFSIKIYKKNHVQNFDKEAQRVNGLLKNSRGWKSARCKLRDRSRK